MVRRWLEVDKDTTKNECNAILQYFIRLFGETISLSLSIDTLLFVFAGSQMDGCTTIGSFLSSIYFK